WGETVPMARSRSSLRSSGRVSPMLSFSSFMSSKSPRATSSRPWLEPPPPYRSKLQDEAPEHPHGSHEGNGQLDLTQVDYTIPDKKLLAVPVELVVARVDPEKSKALLGDRPNTRRPIRRRVHRGIAKRADILPSLGHG